MSDRLAAECGEGGVGLALKRIQSFGRSVESQSIITYVVVHMESKVGIPSGLAAVLDASVAPEGMHASNPSPWGCSCVQLVMALK